MARYVSDQNQVAFIYESGTYASVSGNGFWPGLVQSHDIDESMGVINLRYIGAGDRNVDQFVDGPEDYTGTLSLHPQNWRFLAFALGSCVDGGSPSPYTHVISETNSDNGNAFTSGVANPFMSFTLEDGHQFDATNGLNFVRTINGCVVNSLTISATQGEAATMEVNYIGQALSFGSEAVTSITEDTARPFLWKDFQLQIPSGTVYCEMTDFSWSINNNLEAPHYICGSRVIGAPIPLNRDYELTATFHGTSEHTKTLYDQYFTGGSTFNAMLQGIASTGSREIYVIMSGCKMTDMSAPSPVEGVNTQSITINPATCVVHVNDLTELYNPW